MRACRATTMRRRAFLTLDPKAAATAVVAAALVAERAEPRMAPTAPMPNMRQLRRARSQAHEQVARVKRTAMPRKDTKLAVRAATLGYAAAAVTVACLVPLPVLTATMKRTTAWREALTVVTDPAPRGRKVAQDTLAASDAACVAQTKTVTAVTQLTKNTVPQKQAVGTVSAVVRVAVPVAATVQKAALATPKASVATSMVARAWSAQLHAKSGMASTRLVCCVFPACDVTLTPHPNFKLLLLRAGTQGDPTAVQHVLCWRNARLASFVHHAEHGCGPRPRAV